MQVPFALSLLLAGAAICGVAMWSSNARNEVRAQQQQRQPVVVEVEAGPHVERFPAGALDALLSCEWRVSRLSDRTGARLEGGAIPRSGPDLAAPTPMRRGCVQVTTDGTPIVLGPDHPTTGGYPVLAVVRATSFGALARKRAGEVVRFRLARVQGLRDR